MNFLKLYRESKNDFSKPKFKLTLSTANKTPFPIYKKNLFPLFALFDNDVSYKWKFDDICFEYTPFITIIILGLSITLSAHSPVKSNSFTDDDDYWTSMIAYQFYNGDLLKCNESLSYYTDINGNFLNYAFNPLFLKSTEEQNYLTSIQNK